MKVRDAMITTVHTASRDQTLQTAAQLMWNYDIGALPVIDERGHPIAMITDRDICMAAYTQGKGLADISVHTAMSPVVYSCHPDDLLMRAEENMATHQVRRLPVVNDEGTLIGILSMNDIVLARTRTPMRSAVERFVGDVSRTLAAISRHRTESGQQPS